MQKVGVSICTHCMKETDEFCYYLPLLNVFFEVVENRLGHYMAVVPGNSNVKITIIGRPKMYKGLPLEFHVRCTKEGRTDEITIRPNKRVCPHCYRERREIRYLSSLTGYLPTYTIAIVGRPAVGKSGWTNSCIYGRGKKDTSRLARARQGFVRPVKLVATQMNERDRLIKEMFLTDRRGNEKTLILLCDTPGELLTQDAQTQGS